jgi:isochorismate hydrolase
MTGSNHSHFQKNSDEAVLVMDLQPRLLSSIQHSSILIKNCSVFLQSVAMLELPIIATEQVPQKLGSTVPQMVIAGNISEILAKDSFSAFGASNFCQVIKSSKFKKLTILGIETSICIFLTAMDAIRENIEVTIISDCVGCRIPADGKMCLDQLQENGAQIIPLETYLFGKLASSAHPRFKEISQLIKSRT